MSERDLIPGIFPEPPASAGLTAHAAWERRVGRDYANKELPLRYLERRYGKTAEELAAIARQFPAVAVRVEKKGRRA